MLAEQRLISDVLVRNLLHCCLQSSSHLKIELIKTTLSLALSGMVYNLKGRRNSKHELKKSYLYMFLFQPTIVHDRNILMNINKVSASAATLRRCPAVISYKSEAILYVHVHIFAFKTPFISLLQY